ncbi:MAG: regulatory protein RecX [Alishewanella aestuarii]
MDTLAAWRKTAIGWLSRREHSRAELKQKLLQKGASVAEAETVLEWCQQQGYQNEQRFLEMLLRSRCRQGYGYQYILQEARQHQITATELSALAEQLEIDWWALAEAAYQKKFADKAIADYQDKMKRMAYLQRRGFSSEQIRAVLSNNS